MVEYWKKYWSISDEPFSEEPLWYYRKELGQVLVETEAVSSIKAIVDDLAEGSATNRVYVVGGRGMGKSQLLQYALKEFVERIDSARILPVYVNNVRDDPSPEKLRHNFVVATLYQVFHWVINELPERGYSNPQLIDFFRPKWDLFADKDGRGELSPNEAEALLQNYLFHIHKTFGFRGTALLYDEMDRVEKPAADMIQFLGRSQGLLESISRGHGSVFISGVPSWMTPMLKPEYSGIRGIRVEIPEWHDDDIVHLVNNRFQRFSAYPRNPFKRVALEMIIKQSERRPREVNSLAKFYLILGASERVTEFDEGFCQRLLWKPESINLFFSKVSQDESLYRGLQKLKAAFDPEQTDRTIYRVLLLVYELGGRIRSDVTSAELRKSLGEDLDVREVMRALSALETLRVLTKKRDGSMTTYLLDEEVKDLLRLTSSLNESFKFLPFVIRLRRLDVTEEKPKFDVQVAVTAALMKNLSTSAKAIVESIMTNPESGKAAIRTLTDPSKVASEQYITQSLYRKVNSVLSDMEKQGVVLKTIVRGEEKYMFLPKDVNVSFFEGLPLDRSTWEALEAVEKNYRDRFYDVSVRHCPSVVEAALRALWSSAFAPQECPDESHVAELVADLSKKGVLKGFEFKIHALQLHFDSADRGDLRRIDSTYARSLIDSVEDVVKDVFSEVKALETKTSKAPRLLAEKKIRAGQKATADAFIREWIGRLEADVIGELMFVDKSTFPYLDMIPRGCGIRLVVGHMDDTNACIRYAAKQKTGRPVFKIVKVELPGPNPLLPTTVHERWIGDRKIEIDFGTDLKDNAIGKSEHTIHVFERPRESERSKEFELKMTGEDAELERVYGKGTKRTTLFASTRP